MLSYPRLNIEVISGCSVTVNIPVLGTGDSGFESRHPDNMGKKFAKNKENFTCNKCGHENIGNGYTNHCSKCLWSLHVDVNPGDRLATCQVLMKPIKIEGSTGHDYKVLHKCLICGHEKINKLSEGDNQDVVIQIIKENAAKLGN